MTEAQLEVRQVRHLFGRRVGLLGRRSSDGVRALDGVDLSIARGTTLGLVGESGCGKSTLGRIMVRLLDPTDGEIRYEGLDLREVGRRKARRLRPQIQTVFQDTQSSLDPRMTVESSIAEPIRLNGIAKGAELYELAAELMGRVGLGHQHLQSYPHELSGGQRQRVGIARALATSPKLIVLDEPTSALDVSVQAQILNLLKDLQDELGLTYVFISHNLSVVRAMSDEVAVMYLGRIVEVGPTEDVFSTPLHPYTRMLLSSIPRPDPRLRRMRQAARGELPRPDAPPPGCSFHPRCPRAEERCAQEQPELAAFGGDHCAACHFAGEFQQQPL